MIWLLLFVFFAAYFIVKVLAFKREKNWKDGIVFTLFSIGALVLIAGNIMGDIPPFVNYLSSWTGSLSERLTFFIFGVSTGKGA